MSRSRKSPKPLPMGLQALTVREAALIYSINKFTLYDLIKAGEIPVIKRPRSEARLLVSDMDEFMDKHRVVYERA